jgi:hypothetical protein
MFENFLIILAKKQIHLPKGIIVTPEHEVGKVIAAETLIFHVCAHFVEA